MERGDDQSMRRRIKVHVCSCVFASAAAAAVDVLMSC